MNHIELHNRIDAVLKAGPHAAVVTDVQDLIMADFDTRKYFFSRAGEDWLQWIAQHNFLDAVKEKAEDATSYSYRMPELEYLARVAEERPTEVTDIMMSVDVPNSFNPEVVDRFIWICSKLPAEQLKRILPKIKEEMWVPLMGNYNRWGFEYKSMFEKLSSDTDAEAIIQLASIVLSVKPQEEEADKTPWRSSTPFYFQHITDTSVFESLAAITGPERKTALKLVVQVLKEIAEQGTAGNDEVFELDDTFHLFDVDFFDVSIGEGRHLSARDDVRSLAATAKVLVDGLLMGNCDNSTEVRRVYSDTIAELPDSRAMWRLRLYVWSLCPIEFQQELMTAFDLAFKYENNWSVVSGAEYEWALKKCFAGLPENYKSSYIAQILAYYQKREEKLRSSGYDILSTIIDSLSDEEKEQAKQLFGRDLNPDHKPEPTIGTAFARTIVSEAVISKEAFEQLSIEDIASKLKKEWTPQALREADKERDYLRPRDAEGMGERLQADIKIRLSEYIEKADLFFDRDSLDPHYTYAFMRGVYDAYKELEELQTIDWSHLFGLFLKIREESEKEPFAYGARDSRGFDGWLAGWDSVHNGISDVVKLMLGEEKETKAIPFEMHREPLLKTIKYLLEYPNPVQEEHKKGEPNPATGEIQYQTSDPFTTAINSVRGRTFQSLVLFVYRDSKRIQELTGKDGLSDDVKEIYEQLLARETTEAVMFMFGHYLATFYYRDAEWIHGLLDQIFPRHNSDLFLASWEGHLSSNLYSELFVMLAPLYEYAIELDSEKYTPRRYFAEIDEALAGHIALAYMHFAEFTVDSPLFQKFWTVRNEKRQGAFVSFVGRHAISRDSAKIWARENKVDIHKLETLWDWILENCTDAKVFSEFGFWINTKEGVFEPKWVAIHLRRTLEKSEGKLEWDYGLMQSLPELATSAPEEVVVILRLYLTATEIGIQYRAWVHIDDEMVGIFKTLYRNPLTREATYSLVDELLPRGSGQFWKLKEALE